MTSRSDRKEINVLLPLEWVRELDRLWARQVANVEVDPKDLVGIMTIELGGNRFLRFIPSEATKPMISIPEIR